VLHAFSTLKENHMSVRFGSVLAAVALLSLPALVAPPVPACCPAPPSGKPVVNADQTVVILWDAATKTQHFIRKASFKSEADDFGFLVPTPTEPELEQSGNEAFPYLLKLTEPEKQTAPRPSGGASCGCGMGGRTMPGGSLGVVVLAEKEVAGFKAVVLETGSATALVTWLKDHGYAFSPQVEAWAKPYVESGWKITALKVAKDAEGKAKNDVAAAALRLTFTTDRPIFPYREPDTKSAAEALGAKSRLLRIYFLAEARYQGELTKDTPWTGKVAWAGKLKGEDRTKVLEILKLPANAGPAEWWLTEFEDAWPYQVAPADVTFSRAADQNAVKRPPIIQYVSSPWPADAMTYALAGVLFLWPVWRKLRRAGRGAGRCIPKSQMVKRERCHQAGDGGRRPAAR
jgi:hypothetical protein